MKKLSIIVLLLVLLAVPVMAATNINSCQTLNTPGETYLLTQDVSAADTCFTVAADDITLDCQGFEVEYDANDDGAVNGGRAVTLGTNNDGVTIQNCDFVNDLSDSPVFGGTDYDNFTFQDNTVMVDSNGGNNELWVSGDIGSQTTLSNILIQNNVVIINGNGNPSYGGYISVPKNISFINNDVTMFNTGVGSSVIFELYDDVDYPDDILISGNTWNYSQALYYIYAISNIVVEDEIRYCPSGGTSQCEVQFFENGVSVASPTLIFSNITMTMDASGAGADWIYVENSAGTDVTVLVEDVTIYATCGGGDCTGQPLNLYNVDTAIIDSVYLYGDTGGLSLGGQGDGSTLSMENVHWDSSGIQKFDIFDYASFHISDSTFTDIKFNDALVYTSLNKTFLNTTYNAINWNTHSFVITEEQWARGYAVTTLSNPVDDATITATDGTSALQWTDTTNAQGYTDWQPTRIKTFDDSGDLTVYNPYTSGSNSVEFGLLSLTGQSVNQNFAFSYLYTESVAPPITGNFVGNLQTCNDENYNSYLNFMVIVTILFMVTLPFVKKQPQLLAGAFAIFMVLMAVAGVMMILTGC